jgi:hypothetical protein
MRAILSPYSGGETCRQGVLEIARHLIHGPTSCRRPRSGSELQSCVRARRYHRTTFSLLATSWYVETGSCHPEAHTDAGCLMGRRSQKEKERTDRGEERVRHRTPLCFVDLFLSPNPPASQGLGDIFNHGMIVY